MALSLKAVDIASKKRIGKLKESPVFEIVTTGGLWLNILGKGAGFEIMSTGPHRAVARYIAEQRFPGIEFTELSKSDHVDLQDFLFLVPKYEELTDRLRAAADQREE